MAVPSMISALNYPKSVNTGEKIFLVWKNVASATSYVIERKIDNGIYSGVYTGTATNFLDKIQLGWNSVKYRAKAVNSYGASGYIETESIDIIYIDINQYENCRLYPFDMILNFSQSKFDIIPNVKDTEEEFVGVDGTYSIDTKYEARMFEVIAYSSFLTLQERNELVSQIGSYFDKLKTSSRYLRYNNKLYLVKIADKPEIEIFPNWIELNISFKAHNPHGYSELNFLKGNGAVKVEGDKQTLPTFVINGVATNPIITVNGINYTLSKALTSSDVVTINCEKRTVVLNNNINIIDKWGVDFPFFNVGENTISISNGAIKSLWRNKYIGL